MRRQGFALLETLVALTLAIFVVLALLRTIQAIFAAAEAILREEEKVTSFTAAWMIVRQSRNSHRVEAYGDRIVLFHHEGTALIEEEKPCWKAKLISGRRAEFLFYRGTPLSLEDRTRSCLPGVYPFVKRMEYRRIGTDLKLRLGKGPFQPVVEEVKNFRASFDGRIFEIWVNGVHFKRRLN